MAVPGRDLALPPSPVPASVSAPSEPRGRGTRGGVGGLSHVGLNYSQRGWSERRLPAAAAETIMEAPSVFFLKNRADKI